MLGKRGGVPELLFSYTTPGQERHLFPLSCYPAIRIFLRFTLKTALKLTSARMLLATSRADSANIAD